MECMEHQMEDGMFENFKTLNNKVLYKVMKEAKSTKSGILLAQSVDRKKSKDKGIVICSEDLASGTVILVDKYTSVEIEDTEEATYYICDYSDIYGTF